MDRPRRIATSTIALIPLALALTLAACERKLTLLHADNLRYEIVRSSNEHLLKIDVTLPAREFERIKSGPGPVLIYSDCARRTAERFPNQIGFVESHRTSVRSGESVSVVTFWLLKTNVPAEVPAAMAGVRCVSLRVDRGYGFTGYGSEPIRVSRTIASFE